MATPGPPKPSASSLARKRLQKLQISGDAAPSRDEGEENGAELNMTPQAIDAEFGKALFAEVCALYFILYILNSLS